MNYEKDISSFLESGGVSSGKFRSYMNGGVYENYEDVPENFSHCLKERSPGKRTYDYLGFLQGKKSWVLEPLEKLQPHSYKVLEEKASPLLVGITLFKDHMVPGSPLVPSPYLFFDVCGRMIEVQATFAGSNYEDGDHCFSHLTSLPDELAKSWLWRTGGWRIPGDLPEYVSTYRQLIGHPANSWPETDVYLDSLGRGYKKKYLAKVVERFPDCVVEAKDKYDKRHHYFKCFLDTRPSGIAGPVGDQFFVCAQRTDQVVYHIHRGDVDNIRVLHNPAEAIDRYCGHTLLRTPHEFDFMPWSEPLPT